MSSVPPTGASAPSPAPAVGASGASSTTAKKKTTKSPPNKATGAGTKAKNPKPSKKRKPTSKTSGAASSQAIMGDARAAQLDLAKQRAQAAAKRADPLWYRMEDVLPIVSEANAMTASTSVLPEQATIVESALGNNGLTRSDVTPQAMACLLEQARRFAQELVVNAQDYAYSANRPELTRADLMLAYEMRPDHPVAFSTQLPKLNLVSQQVNRAPLPPIPSHCYSGIVLPPVQHQLTARTYDIVSGATVEQKMVQKAPTPRKSSSNQQPTYGAARGRQIPVKLKEQQPTQGAPVPMDTTPTSLPPSQQSHAQASRPAGMGGPPL